MSPQEKEVFTCNSVQKIYVRYFDVDQPKGQAEPLPVSPVSLNRDAAAYNIVPVVYIKNRVFLQKDSSAIAQLAQNVFHLINKIDSSVSFHPAEIQFDCDWTENTAKPYFYFIIAFKQITGDTISATIRLHQVKYQSVTGVPPVDKAVLMFYNMGEISAGSQNSIYEKSIADRYTSYLKHYKLPLDFALPIFGWGQQIRDGKVIHLLNKININAFRTDTNFTALNDRRLRAKYSFFKAGYYFKENDLVKLESVSEKELLQMAEDLGRNYKKQINTVIFYDIDTINLNRYGKNVFKKVASSFR